MPSLEFRVYSALQASTSVTALVGTRVRPLQLKQGETMPAVSYQRISTVRESEFGSDNGHATSRVQVTSWATTWASADGLKDAVRGALQRYNGSTDVGDTFVVGENHFQDPDYGVFGIALDFRFHHQE